MTEDVELRARELLSEALRNAGQTWFAERALEAEGTFDPEITALTNALTISQEQRESAKQAVSNVGMWDGDTVGDNLTREEIYAIVDAAFTSAGMKCL